MNTSSRTILRDPWFWLGIAGLQAVVATLGSLYFSNILGYEPCLLCWWQRIFIYPLVIILPIAYFTRDRGVVKYAVPLLAIGSAFSLYHNMIYYISMYRRLNPTGEITTCSLTGPSCTAVYIEWFGFITIPFLALVAFIVIGVALALFVKYSKTTK